MDMDQTYKSMVGDAIQKPLIPEMMKPLPTMKWEPFTGQHLEVGDLMWFKEGGLAFVDTTCVAEPDGSYYPDRISSIPDGWLWTFEMDSTVNSRIRPANNEYDLRRSCITKKGKLMRPVYYGGEHVDTLLYICKIKPPINGRKNSTKTR